MVAFNTKNIQKIAQFNPSNPPINNQPNSPVFILDFDELPALYRLTINVTLYGLLVSNTYRLAIDIYDNNDARVLNDELTIDSSNTEFTKDRMIVQGIGIASFSILLKPLTIPEQNNNTFRIVGTLLDKDGTTLDTIKTFFFAKMHS